MLRSRFWPAVLLLAAGLPKAAAQEGYAFQYSLDYFNLMVSSPSVTIDYLSGGVYTNGIRPIADGDADNERRLGQQRNNYNRAQNYSFSDPGSGYASQFNGIRYVIRLDNTSEMDETFTLTEMLREYNEDDGDATSISYGGFQETGGQNLSGYDELTIDRDGEAFNDPFRMRSVLTDYQNGEYSEAYVSASGRWTGTLLPDETVRITVYAAGRTAVNRPIATPAPSAAIAFAIPALARRRTLRRVKTPSPPNISL